MGCPSSKQDETVMSTKVHMSANIDMHGNDNVLKDMSELSRLIKECQGIAQNGKVLLALSKMKNITNKYTREKEEEDDVDVELGVTLSINETIIGNGNESATDKSIANKSNESNESNQVGTINNDSCQNPFAWAVNEQIEKFLKECRKLEYVKMDNPRDISPYCSGMVALFIWINVLKNKIVSTHDKTVHVSKFGKYYWEIVKDAGHSYHSLYRAIKCVYLSNHNVVPIIIKNKKNKGKEKERKIEEIIEIVLGFDLKIWANKGFDFDLTRYCEEKVEIFGETDDETIPLGSNSESIDMTCKIMMVNDDSDSYMNVDNHHIVSGSSDTEFNFRVMKAQDSSDSDNWALRFSHDDSIEALWVVAGESKIHNTTLNYLQATMGAGGYPGNSFTLIFADSDKYRSSFALKNGVITNDKGTDYGFVKSITMDDINYLFCNSTDDVYEPYIVSDTLLFQFV